MIKLFYDFPYDISRTEGDYGQRHMSLHCVWAWCNFLNGHLETCWAKPYRDCVEIVQCWYSCHAVSVESAQICTAVVRTPYRGRAEMVQLL